MNKNLVSVSLNQVKALALSDNSLVLHRQKIFQICVVGNVLNVNEQTTKISYTITDYTGPAMEVVLWKNSGGDEQKMINLPVIMEQTYVKAYGQARKDPNGSVYIVAFHIESLANLNDLTLHLIEVVHHVKNLKRIKLEFLCNSQSGGNGQIMESGKNTVSGFSEIQNIVLNLIKANNDDNGMSLDEIYNSIKSAKQDTVKSAIEFLLNEGHIYEALDEYHFKSSD